MRQVFISNGGGWEAWRLAAGAVCQHGFYCGEFQLQFWSIKLRNFSWNSKFSKSLVLYYKISSPSSSFETHINLRNINQLLARDNQNANEACWLNQKRNNFRCDRNKMLRWFEVSSEVTVSSREAYQENLEDFH